MKANNTEKNGSKPAVAEAMARPSGSKPDWWVAVPESEKIVLRNAIGAIRLQKKSRSPQIASAAQKWDATISCFIRARLMNRKVRLSTGNVRSISRATNGRNQQGGAGARG